MNNIIAVFIGGGIGSLFRYGISTLTATIIKTSFPIATLASNVLSCIILALTVTIINSKPEAGNWKLFIITGICGGFSTFSTFSFETVDLIRNGNTMYAIANVTISILVCFALVYLLAKNQTA